MIRITRPECPAALIVGSDPRSFGEDETLDAIDFFAEEGNARLSFRRRRANGTGRTQDSYLAYKDDETRRALSAMCHNKCAYCESIVTVIYSGDIEHFRPKGGHGSESDLNKPGYYWLAANWENLLFACPFCNQTNTHEILENGTIVEVVLGKLNQFPLLTENFRLNRMHGQLYFRDHATYDEAFAFEEAERLLLKPCTDDVARYFKYLDEGVIMPSDTLNDFEELQASTSIKVYALMRLSVVREREKKIIEIKAQIRRVEEATINYDNSTDELQKQRFEDILSRELQILREFALPDRPYAGLARFFVNTYLSDAFDA